MTRITRKILHLTLAVAAVAVATWVVASGWGGHIDPRSWSLPAVLGLTYPVALAAAMVMLLVSAIFRSWKVVLGLVLAIVITWPSLRVTVPLSGGSAIADSTRTFTVLTYNVMSFDSYYVHEDTSSTMRYVLNTDADVVVLQEASLGSRDFTDMPAVLPMKEEIQRKYPYLSHGYHDLIILSRYPYTVLEDTTLRNGMNSNGDGGFHSYAKVFDIDLPGGHDLRIINVHLQSIGLSASDKQVYRNLTNLDSVQTRSQMSRMRHSLYNKLAAAFRRRAQEAEQLRHIVEISGKNVMVCGDFNDTPASYTYWTVRGDDMDDAFAHCGWGYTHTFNSDMMLFNIDHILYKGDMKAVSIRRDKVGTSDHYPQLVTFEWKSTP
ncbi:MAG: endonuclease/exonuclease/phosphatase family protein [Muribaculaceae bacterium]|nr:endonuclease/exonuclease/phosphatase family protein [Muribaculaceae bacterium]